MIHTAVSTAPIKAKPLSIKECVLNDLFQRYRNLPSQEPLEEVFVIYRDSTVSGVWSKVGELLAACRQYNLSIENIETGIEGDGIMQWKDKIVDNRCRDLAIIRFSKNPTC